MARLPEGNVAQYPTWRVLYRSTISRIMFHAACAYPFHVWWTWIQFKINAFDVCPPYCVEGLFKHVCKCIIWTIPFNGVADLITYEYWSWYPIQYIYIYMLISSIYIYCSEEVGVWSLLKISGSWYPIISHSKHCSEWVVGLICDPLLSQVVGERAGCSELV